jgi:hypothetical protein
MSHTALKGGKDGLPKHHTSFGAAGPSGMNSIRSQGTSVARASHPVGGRMKPAKEHTKSRRRRK